MANYSYSNITDFTNASIIILSELQDDIENSSITSAAVLYCIEEGDTITIYFDGALSGPDQTTLTGLVNAYTTGVSENIVTDTGVFNLSDKNLYTDTNFFIDPVITTKRLGFSTSGATSGATLTLASISSTSKTITFPDITDTVVTLTASQSLTNKTLTNVVINGLGSTTASSSSFYSIPSSTSVSAANNYYFNYLAQPVTTGSTTGSAYTFYIENAPSGTITNPYSLYVAAGKTYIGGVLQIASSPNSTYFLKSDSLGNASWQYVSFTDGSAASPGIYFTSDPNSGFYSIAGDQIGVSLGGVSYLSMTASAFTLTTGQTLNVGTSGTTSPLNVYGLVTGSNGLTINNGLSSLQTVTAANTVTFNGTGSTTFSTATLNSSPSTTSITGSNNYFFNYFTAPTTTGSTTGSASTIYIAGAPSGTITNPYSVYIAGGKTYIGGTLQIPTGAVNGYVLTSDGSGNATWITPEVITSFPDGTVSSPGIYYTNDTDTGFYRIGANQIGVALGGSNYISFGTSSIDVTNGGVLNIGTSGSTSSLNVYGFCGFFGSGSNVVSSATLYSAPASTVASSSNNYYFNYLDQPIMTGSTTGSAYTLYISNSPSGTITNPYAFYIAAGKTYLGGDLQISTSPSNGYVLTSDSLGNATWQAPSIVSTFSDGTEALPGISFSNETSTGFYRPAAFQIGITINGIRGFLMTSSGVDISTGSTMNLGTSGTTSPLNVYGLITSYNGLTVSSGASLLQAVTASGLITASAGVTVTTGQTLNIGTSGTTSPLNVYGLVTGSNGLTINNGLSSLQAVTASGLITASAGVTVTTGQTVNVGTAGTTSPLNVYGLITGTNGLTINNGLSSLQAVTASGLITASAGLTVSSGQTFSSIGIASFSGTGSNVVSSATLYSAPASTVASGSNNYYFNYLDQPIMTGSTTGSAYTLYISNSPSGTITNPYAFYIAAGKTYLGGSVQLSSGAANGYIAVSNSNGDLTWTAPSLLGVSFSDGSAASPGIYFTSDPNSGFYSIAGDQIGVSLGGVSYLSMTASAFTLTTGQTLNVGTSGTTSPLNVYGLVTGSNGLTINNGLSSLQAITASGLITASAGVTVTTGQTLNVGTAGTTSPLNVYGLITGTNGLTINNGLSSLQSLLVNTNAQFIGSGNIDISLSAIYAQPATTAITGSNTYYFSSFKIPVTTGSTTGSAYTIFIEGQPSGTIGNSYSLYSASGKNYFGGQVQFASGAVNGYIAVSNGIGDLTWTSPSNLAVSFPDGTAALPGIFFTSQPGTGFYRPGSGQIGVELSGVNYITFGTSSTDFINGTTLNLGSSGTSSSINLYGTLNIHKTNNQITLGTTNKTTFSVTPTADRTLTFPDITDTVVTLTAFQTLSNKTIDNLIINGSGDTAPVLGTLYSNPSTTFIDGANTYYWNYFNTPVVSGTTTGAAYTVFIAGPPAGGSITTPYSLFITTGKTYIGGTLQLPAGAGNGYVLTSDANGNASWSASGGVSFGDGTSSLPSIFFLNEPGTGFYRPGAGQIGVELSGVNYVTFKTTSTDFINGTVLNIGTSGTTSIENIYGTLNIKKTNDQIILGTTNTTTITTSPTASRTITIPDITDTLVTLTAVQTLTNKTLNNVDISGVGDTASANSPFYSLPSSTAVSGSNNYYFNYFDVPPTTGTTTGSAYNVYISGPPSGTITNPYSLYIANGKTYCGGTLQIPTGAVDDYVLTSDSVGNSSWVSPLLIATFSTYTAVSGTSQGTTSTMAVNVPDMILNPTVAGTYLIQFISVCNVSTNNRVANFELAKNGTLITGATQSLTIANASTDVSVSISITATANGTSDVFTARYYITGTGTLTLPNYRFIVAIRTGV